MYYGCAVGSAVIVTLRSLVLVSILSAGVLALGVDLIRRGQQWDLKGWRWMGLGLVCLSPVLVLIRFGSEVVAGLLSIAGFVVFLIGVVTTAINEREGLRELIRVRGWLSLVLGRNDGQVDSRKVSGGKPKTMSHAQTAGAFHGTHPWTPDRLRKGAFLLCILGVIDFWLSSNDVFGWVTLLLAGIMFSLSWLVYRPESKRSMGRGRPRLHS